MTDGLSNYEYPITDDELVKMAAELRFALDEERVAFKHRRSVAAVLLLVFVAISCLLAFYAWMNRAGFSIDGYVWGGVLLGFLGYFALQIYRYGFEANRTLAQVSQALWTLSHPPDSIGRR